MIYFQNVPTPKNCSLVYLPRVCSSPDETNQAPVMPIIYLAIGPTIRLSFRSSKAVGTVAGDFCIRPLPRASVPATAIRRG